jgi:carbon starvation protein
VDALLIVVVSFAGYLIAYHTYGRFLARRIFRLDDGAPVPSRELADGVDYVPTRKGIIFGHHYTSIAGTGPIVGPAIGIIWGWVPALVWVFVGSIVMGAVHDFGALVMSLRNEGKSLSEIAARYVSRTARTIFFLIAFLELLIVIAIFGVVISTIFKAYAESVLPIWCEIPIAVVLGLAIYRWKRNVALATFVAVAAMYATVVAGHYLPLEMPAVGSLSPTAVWVVILLGYAFVASAIPVTTLLQPRDYINAWQLFIAMALLVVGVFGAALIGGPHGTLQIVAPAAQASPPGAPPIWPFLFVTIACGAISGFHALVASGTTPKQIRRESDALFVGYGSMLLESALAVLVIVAVAAGIGMGYTTDAGETLTGAAAWQNHYHSWSAAGGLTSKVKAVVEGSASMIATVGIDRGLAVVIIGVFIASFAGTTLDTATRIQRYVIGELAGDFKIPLLGNRWAATAVAVVTAGLLAFAASPGGLGTGALVLWPMFGAVNQLLAALALLLASIYLKRRTAWGHYVTLLPCLFMLVMTFWAVIANQVRFIETHKPWVLIAVNGLMLVVAAALVVESARVFFRRREPASPPAGS